jgi:hypothetical protein
MLSSLRTSKGIKAADQKFSIAEAGIKDFK